MNYQGIKAQIVDMPPIGSESFDMGTIHTADCLIIVIESIKDLEKISPFIKKAYGKKIIALNKSDLVNSTQLRKLEETIKSKRVDATIISTLTGNNIEVIKKRIFQCMDSIRIYTKEPGKPPSPDPVVLAKDSTIRDVAESILKGFSQKVKETRITGPSSKFPNQRVGLDHKLKDKDIVEFKTK